MQTTTKQLISRNQTGLHQKRPIKAVQFGEGNFLRAFVDYLIDKLNEETDFDGGIAVLQGTSEGLIESLQNQENLYTLFLRGVKQGQIIDQKRIISSIEKSFNPYSEYPQFLELAKEDQLQFIFSNTTESGIVFDKEENDYNAGPHKNFPAKVTVLLHERFQFYNGDYLKGLTIIPCELIDKNGEMLQKYVLQYANHWGLGEAFKNWVTKSCSFHNTLVDRIVPGYPKDNINEYLERLDYDDKLIVVGENFLLWVIEGDSRLKDKIPFHKISEQILIVDDMTPYRDRKVRILNGAHTAMLSPCLLANKETVKEAIDDDFTGKYITDTVYQEIIPTLNLSNEELKVFSEEVFDRFRNPFIKHHLSSIALNSISKFKVRVLPSILEYVNRFNKIPLNLAFSFGTLIQFYQGSFNGISQPVKDDKYIIDKVNSIWAEEDLSEVVRLMLSEKSFWDIDLTEIPQLLETITKALQEIRENGIEIGYQNFIQNFKD